MADIELVIKIPKAQYDIILRSDETWAASFASKEAMMYAIKTGTLLSKGHGDLIDRSKIYKAIPAEEDNCTGMGMTLEEMDAYNDGIDAMYSFVEHAKPIIEADKAESEDKE